MDTMNMANLVTASSQAGLQQQVGVAVQKKAMQIQASTALALLQALPPVQPSLPAHLGQNINTTA